MILLLGILSLNNSFFWDTVQLGSKHANFYFSENFAFLLLPDEIDSGHIPAFGMYIALAWKIFGRNLPAGHLAIMPFAIGIVWQLYKLIRNFIPPKFAALALLMVLLDPTLLSQITLVSPDVLLVFFFLLGVNAVIENKRLILALAVFFLFLISMRGMMVALCVLGLDMYCNINFTKGKINTVRLLLKRSLIYLPALLLLISYSVYHYKVKGWLFFHEGSPWSESFSKVDFKGFLLKTGILGWRILDFGRAGIWLVFLVLLIRLTNSIFHIRNIRLPFVLFCLLLIILPANMLWAKNLLGHRYLIPVYLSFAIFCASILFSSLTTVRLKYILTVIWLVVLITGNLWIYPPQIAQGWDSSLAHLPYYNLRKQSIEYLDSQKIDFDEVQSFFPNTSKIDDIDLNGDERNFNLFNGQGEYVFYSNVFNINDDAIKIMKDDYELIKIFKKKGIYISLSKRIRR